MQLLKPGGEPEDMATRFYSHVDEVMTLPTIQATVEWMLDRGYGVFGLDLREWKPSGRSLRRVVFDHSDLRGVDFTGSCLHLATFGGALLEGCRFDLDIPVIPNLDATILAHIKANEGALEMANWHVCATTHCRAGWAIALGGKAGYALEHLVGAETAGALIYAKSRPEQPIPSFYAKNRPALEDMGDPDPEGTIANCSRRAVKPEARQRAQAELRRFREELHADVGSLGEYEEYTT